MKGNKKKKIIIIGIVIVVLIVIGIIAATVISKNNSNNETDVNVTVSENRRGEYDDYEGEGINGKKVQKLIENINLKKEKQTEALADANISEDEKENVIEKSIIKLDGVEITDSSEINEDMFYNIEIEYPDEKNEDETMNNTIKINITTSSDTRDINSSYLRNRK